MSEFHTALNDTQTKGQILERFPSLGDRSTPESMRYWCWYWYLSTGVICRL